MDKDTEERLLALYNNNKQYIERIILGILLKKSAVEDVLQDLWIKMYRNPEYFLNHPNKRAAILRTAINLSFTYLRREHIYEKSEEINEDLIEDINRGKNPAIMAETNIIRKEIYKILDQLPIEESTIFEMRAIEEYKLEEIANILRIPFRRVTYLYYDKARPFIKEKLEEKGFQINDLGI